MYCVQISARIIRWPGICACCGHSADTNIEISSTRTTGKRVIRTQTKSWEVPYCSRCLSHIRAARELRSFSRIVVNLSLVIGLAGAALSLLIFGLIVWQSVILAVFLSLLLVAGTVVLLSVTWRSCQARYRRHLTAKKAERARLERRLESLLCDTCSRESRCAAEYEGWYGSVHTFYFCNADFATALERANPGKCLRGGQVHR